MSIDGVKATGFIVKPFVLNPQGAKGTVILYLNVNQVKDLKHNVKMNHDNLNYQNYKMNCLRLCETFMLG
jgi:hypothetical protein